MVLRHSLANCQQRSAEPPGGVVNVLVATKDGKSPAGLEHIPWPTSVVFDSRPGWSAAANALLDQSAEEGRDAIFIDDDVTILPETFDGFDHYYQKADVFGFRLRGEHGQQIGWGLRKQNLEPDRACYIAHVTASLLYIRASVLKAGVRFPVWPGLHFEDIKFTYDCWLHGFAVAYLPMAALHAVSPTEDGQMIGATLRHGPDLLERRKLNRQHLDQWAQEQDMRQAAEDGRIPYGVWGIDP